MSIGTVLSESGALQTARCPFAETSRQPVETARDGAERPLAPLVKACNGTRRETPVNEDKKQEPAPPPTLSGAPEQELERKLKRNPDDQDAKADVGSDESMDASDPPCSNAARAER